MHRVRLCFSACLAPLPSRRLFCPSDARNSPAATPPLSRRRGGPLAHRYEMACSRVTGGLPVRSNYQKRRHKHRPVNPLQLHSEASFCFGLLSTVICRLVAAACSCQAPSACSDRPEPPIRLHGPARPGVQLRVAGQVLAAGGPGCSLTRRSTPTSLGDQPARTRDQVGVKSSPVLAE